jgi:hypothetical protein
MRQIIADCMKKFVKQELENYNYTRCKFKTEPIGNVEYCHFLVDIGCGFWNPEPYNIDLPERQEFYKCDLPQKRLGLEVK